MSPQRNFSLAPRQQNVGMVSLFLSQHSHAIDEIQRFLEVRELELAVQVMTLHDGPQGNHPSQSFHFLGRERWNPSAARHTLLIGKLFGHRIPRTFNRLRKKPDSDLVL